MRNSFISLFYNNLRSIIGIYLCCLLHLESSSQNNHIQNGNLVLIETIMEDIFNPMVASRNMLYPNIAAYEVYCLQDSTLRSLHYSVKNFPKISYPIDDIDLDLASEVAFIYTAKKYIYDETKLTDLWTKDSIHFQKELRNNSRFNHSYSLGRDVAAKIFDWSKGDHYQYTRTLMRYILSDSLGAWKPTPSEYANGLEPNWSLMRKIVFDSLEFQSYPPIDPYREDKESSFYKNAFHVYHTSKSITNAQKEIALYWDDNPFSTVSKGHLSYAIKKPTPGNHWMKIASQVIGEKKLNPKASSQVMMTLSIGIYEAFIQCWYVKYQTNSIRPETYIQRLIDPSWTPVIETPPFPEYTSGHSTVSASAATILSNFFGNSYAFTDSSQITLDMKPRSFSSFHEAANEASISRLYGGIHYLPALFVGSDQGRKIGIRVLQKVLNVEK